ncbi:MAG: ABC-2 type transport system ATP-binding protein [Paracoccaceae bacterium]
MRRIPLANEQALALFYWHEYSSILFQYMKFLYWASTLLLVATLTGCAKKDDASAIQQSLIREIVITSPTPNDTSGSVTTFITASVFLPEQHLHGIPYPLIVHSHGWGGSRVSGPELTASQPETAASTSDYFTQVNSQLRTFRKGGYAVISFDQRGFGRGGDDGDEGSEGGSHGMSPDFEIQDAKAVVDWAVANLTLLTDDAGDPRIGLLGNSYGGAFQPMLAAEDPRIDAIAPSIAWFNLRDSFAPNDVLKKAWLIALCNKIVEEDGAQLSTEMELACTQVRLPTARELADAPITENLFFDNGVVSYTSDPNFVMPAVDALILQGIRDTLFPLSEGMALYDFLRAAGGDVRLLTHESGHTSIRHGAGSQGPMGRAYCGNIDVITTIKQWFDEKLYDKLPVALPRICLSLDDNRAVHLDAIEPANREHRVSIPPLTTVLGSSENNVTSSAGDALFFPLPQITDPNLAVIGKPIARLFLQAGPANSDPTPLSGPNSAAIFVGVGILRHNVIFLVDDQVQPILSTDPRTGESAAPIELLAVAEKLEVGDRVGILIYGKHDLYENHPIDSDGTGSNWQGNVATVLGDIDLPIVSVGALDQRAAPGT